MLISNHILRYGGVPEHQVLMCPGGGRTDAWYAGNQLDEMYQAVVEDRYRSPYERWCGKKPHIDMFARFW